MPGKNIQSCTNCRFAGIIVGDSNHLNCLFNPPQIIAGPSATSPNFFFPVMSLNDWCGRWAGHLNQQQPVNQNQFFSTGDK